LKDFYKKNQIQNILDIMHYQDLVVRGQDIMMQL